MITKEMLAAIDDFELHEFIGTWTDPDTGERLDLEANALLDCEILRRGPDFVSDGGASMIVEDWESWGVPASVPKLKVELRKAIRTRCWRGNSTNSDCGWTISTWTISTRTRTMSDWFKRKFAWLESVAADPKATRAREEQR
jgi:hypothetical protein